MTRDAVGALMRRGAGHVLLLVALSACGQHGDEAAPVAPVATATPERIAAGVPHGGSVTTLAITEEADAALSADNLGRLRFWPSLDGKRPPVPISSVAPGQLALTHVPASGDAKAPTEMLAAILDQAGTVRLLRLGRDGVVHARFQLASDVPCEEVIAIEGGVLVRRADQSLEKYDANGISRGRLVTEPGERLMAIAARHGSVIGLIATTKAEGANTLRWILAEGELRWGTTITLPVTVATPSIALSPNHRRIAVRDLETTSLAVYEIVPLPKVVVGHAFTPTSLANTPADSVFGFIDDDHVAMGSTAINWWTASADQTDPWATAEPSDLPPPATRGFVGGAISDGLIVTAQGGALVLTTPTHSRFLGWSDLANGAAVSTGHRIAYTISASRLIWLDDQLDRVREVDVNELPGVVGATAIAVGDHHVAVQMGDKEKFAVKVIDLDHPANPIVIGTFDRIDLLAYSPDVHDLVVRVDRVAHRYAIDLDRGTSTELPALTAPQVLGALFLTDPARAGGVIAVSSGFTDEGATRMLVFRQAAKERTIKPSSSSVLNGDLVAVATDATIFTHAPGSAIIATRGGKQVGKIPLDTDGGVITVREDGARIAHVQTAQIVLYDLNGTLLWRQPLWGAHSVTFTPDERRLLVQTSSGIIVLDASTGARVQAVCAWGFGLSEHPSAQPDFGLPPVCED